MSTSAEDRQAHADGLQKLKDWIDGDHPFEPDRYREEDGKPRIPVYLNKPEFTRSILLEGAIYAMQQALKLCNDSKNYEEIARTQYSNKINLQPFADEMEKDMSLEGMTDQLIETHIRAMTVDQDFRRAIGGTAWVIMKWREQCEDLQRKIKKAQSPDAE